jgi:hypothetical protein
LKNWISAIDQKALYQTRLPLGVFLDPDILLNTLRQKTCRQIKKSLDDLEMSIGFGENSENLSIFSLKVAIVNNRSATSN